MNKAEERKTHVKNTSYKPISDIEDYSSEQMHEIIYFPF